MGELLLINPRRRRRAATAKRRRPATAKRRASTRRRRNPVPALSPISAIRRRRANPIRRAKRRVSRRRRNPIGGARLSTSSIGKMLKQALIGGAGSVAVDFAMGQINGYLPLTLRKVPGQIGVYDAVKAGITIALGHFLSKPTKGLSQQAAMGALTVQAADAIKSFMPAELRGGLGYASPALVTNYSGRVGPIRRGAGVGAYMAPGQTALLSAYTNPGLSPTLNGGATYRSMRAREGVMTR